MPHGHETEKARLTVMEWSYVIDPDRGLVHLTVFGEVTAQGLIELIKRTGADSRFGPGTHAIADCRGAYGTWDHGEIQRFRDFLQRIPTPRPVRWATVLKPDTLATVGKVCGVMADAVARRIEIQLFTDPQRAQEWIADETV